MLMQGRQDVRLYYGTRNTEATAYSDLDDSWKSVGVDTVHVYSDDNKGYVQDVLSQVILIPSCHGQLRLLSVYSAYRLTSLHSLLLLATP